MVDITVLLPVYDGAPYLDDTLSSLSQQSFDRFEVLCIDDWSSDNSADILRAHAAKDPRFKYLNTGTNLGSAGRAANFSAPHARGLRFVYSSQDDLFSPDWLEKLHTRAQETGADAVLPDIEFYHEESPRQRRITGFRGDHNARLTGQQAFAASLDWTISGNALWPISFLHDKGFATFGAFADEYTVRAFFLACKEVVFCDGVFFYRQDNQAAITKKPSPGRLDEADNALRVWRLAMEAGVEASAHGPCAVRTLRTIIRMQAIIINNPSLRGETTRILTIWRQMQTAEFRASLLKGLRLKGSAVQMALYARAQASERWFFVLAHISAWAARRRKNS
jgi:hypothetical protein